MKLVYKFTTKKMVILDKLSFNSKNLYNQTNYIIRNKYFLSNEKPNYYDLVKFMRNIKNLQGDINYKLLPAKTSQQINGSLNIMRKVLGNISFRKLVDSRIWYNPIKIRNVNSNSLEQFLLKGVQ